MFYLWKVYLSAILIYICNAYVYKIDVVCNECRVVYVWNACVYSYVCIHIVDHIRITPRLYVLSVARDTVWHAAA